MKRIARSQKLLKISHSLWRGKTRLSYLPIRLWIELTNNCNLRCIMCPQSNSNSIEQGFMSFSFFKRIINEVKDFVYDINLHHRGESLLHPDLFRMIDYAKRAGLYTRLHTNGTILDDKKARAIIDAELDLLSFSFDGYTAETYERIRQNANFEITFNNILKFLKMKKKLGKTRPYTVFETMELPEAKTNNYVNARKELKRKLYSTHLNKFVIKSKHNWAGINKPKERNVSIESTRFSGCAFPWFAMVIFWNGDVSPCPQDFFGSFNMGNLNDSSTISLWNNDSYISLRKTLKSRDISRADLCLECDMLSRNTFLSIPTQNLKKFYKEIYTGHQ